MVANDKKQTNRVIQLKTDENGISPELMYARKYLKSLTSIPKNASKGVVTYLGDRGTARLLRDVKTYVNNLIEVLPYEWSKKLLNTPKGVFNIDSGKLEPRNGRFFQQEVTEFNPNATAPNFERFLDGLNSDNNPDMATDLLHMIAYAVFHDNNQKFFVIFHGKGNDGKTTLQTAISHALGSYASKIQTTALNYRKDRRFNPAIGDMNRARYFFASELNEGTMLDHALLKEITSKPNAIVPYEIKGSNITSHAHISGVLTLDSNYMPLLSEADPAILRRIATFEFENSIDKTQMDLNLTEKLENEASGILNLIIAYYEPDWIMPQKYFEKTQELLENQTSDKDELIKYEFEQTAIITNDDNDRMRQAELHSYYGFTKNGIKPKDIKKFLKSQNIKEKKSMGIRFYVGIKPKFNDAK
ncbi:hypothetical protein [Lentilactobacillus senioris]|nr:hypothetical protein [Lentilactobacillus senioris]